MALDYVATSKKIVDAVGGVGNIASASHCMTRLRLVLNDEGKANDDAVKAIKGVKSVIKQGGQYQVVIGNEVSNLFKEFKKLGNFAEDGGSAAPKKAEGNVIQRLFGFVSGCLTPMLPAMLGTGMVKVLLVLLTTLNLLDSTSPTYTIIFGMADSFFFFLPVLLGWSIAKKTGHSVPLYMVIGAALVYPDLITLLGGAMEGVTYGVFLGQQCTYLFGFLPVICASYSSSVLPMLLMTPVMGWAEDFADKVSPNVVKAFLKPMIFLLICTPVVFVVLGPLGSILGSLLAAGMSALYNAVPWLTVGILSAAMPFIVMTGMHYALIPLCLNNMAILGYDVVVIVTMFCSNICQGAASLGAGMKSKNPDTRSEGLACAISAIVAGVTEPAMYGINMRYMKPMIGAVCGAGVAGLLAGITGVKGYTMGGSPSIMTLINFVNTDLSVANPYSGVIWGAICGVLGMAIAFAISFILFKDEGEEAAPAVEGGTAKIEAANAAFAGADAPAAEKKAEPVEIDAPMNGKIVPLSEVPDEVFATGVLGEGVAILPSDGKVYAPCDAAVSQMMDSRHAIGLVADNGVEILIHVGLETVALEGKPFTYHVKADQEVKKGDLLLTADLDAITAAGCKLFTPVIITNSDDYVNIEPVKGGDIKAGEKLITVS